MKKLSLTLLAILATTSFASVTEQAAPAKPSILEQAANNHPGADVVRKKKKRVRKGKKRRAPRQEEDQFDAPAAPQGGAPMGGGQGGGFQPQGGPQNPPVQGIPDSAPRPNNPGIPSAPPPPSM